MRRPLELRYGGGTVPLDGGTFPAVETAAAKIPPIFTPPDAIVRRRLERPIASLRLRELLRKGETVAIAVSDITRYSATEIFLPKILEETDAAGIPRRDVTIFIARGTHRALTETELAQVIGPAIDSGVRVEQSDPDGPMRSLGTTSRGTPVSVYRPLMEHDRIVLTGTISFHYFAGFGGGRKALVPGCASRETAMATHFRIFRTDGPGKHPMARSGILARNPVHEDIVEAVSLAAPAFLFNTLLAPDGRIFDAVAGHWLKAHEEGCTRYARTFRVPVPRKSPLVIASAGGYPKDINFIQAHKALDHAFHAVAEDGALILLAECRDGFGSADFFPWFRFEDPAEMERALRADYRIYGQTAHAALVKAKACRVILVSGLAPADVERMGMTPAASLAEAVRIARGHLGELPVPLVIPDAGYVLPEPAA